MGRSIAREKRLAIKSELAAGRLTTRQIAKKLAVSESTIGNVVKSIDAESIGSVDVSFHREHHWCTACERDVGFTPCPACYAQNRRRRRLERKGQVNLDRVLGAELPKSEGYHAVAPIIGVNTDLLAKTECSPDLCVLPLSYPRLLEWAGAVPLVFPPLCALHEVGRLLDCVDGLLLTGGADLDCRRDGYALHHSMRLLDPRREDFDRKLVDNAGKRHMPLMAVGAGMQLLNVSRGGTLFFDIAEDLPRALPHFDNTDPNHRHALVTMGGTLMKRAYEDAQICVNSAHHMAVDDVAPGFVITARCPDGVVEAIESTNEDWFAFGVQFHPERESATLLDACLFCEFVDGVRARMKKSRSIRS